MHGHARAQDAAGAPDDAESTAPTRPATLAGVRIGIIKRIGRLIEADTQHTPLPRSYDKLARAGAGPVAALAAATGKTRAQQWTRLPVYLVVLFALLLLLIPILAPPLTPSTLLSSFPVALLKQDRIGDPETLAADADTENHIPLTVIHPWQSIKSPGFPSHLVRVPGSMLPRGRVKTPAPDLAATHVALVGNCEAFMGPENSLKTTTKFMRFTEMGEQLTSALLPLHSLLKIANATGRVLLGPFVTERNRYSSRPDTYAISVEDQQAWHIDGLPRQFISKYWDLRPILAVYSNLCLMVSNPDHVAMCPDRKTLAVGIMRPEGAPHGPRLIHPRVKAIPEAVDLDLRKVILQDADLRRSTCVEIRGFQRLFVRGDPTMYTYDQSNSPQVPLPQWFEASKLLANRSAQFMDRNENEALGERLFWMFTPAAHIRKKAEDYWRSIKADTEHYMSLHLRMEFVYSPMLGGCDKHPLGPTYPSLNMCILDKCPPKAVLKNLAQQIRLLQGRHALDRGNHVFVARDFGEFPSSSSLRDTPLDGLSAEEAGLDYFDEMDGHMTERHGRDDPATNSMVDMVLLVNAFDCIRVGGGSFGMVVDYYREARGMRKCRVFNHIDRDTCVLHDNGEALLSQESAWKILTGQNDDDMGLWLEKSIARRAKTNLAPPDPFEELDVPGRFFSDLSETVLNRI